MIILAHNEQKSIIVRGINRKRKKNILNFHDDKKKGIISLINDPNALGVRYSLTMYR